MIPHIFLTHCSVDGHLGRFHILAIVNRATVNIRVHVPFGIMVFSGVGLLDHVVALVLVFKGTSISFSIVTVPIYIPSNRVGAFLHILSSIYCL